MAKRKSTGLENLRKPTLVLKHSSLHRFSDSAYKSHCPVCRDGVLLVRRDPKTFKLEEDDFCVSCGQTFRYSDIEKLRARED
jgi:hypothetical protein